jgi:YD repeat-containing protein
MRYGEYRLYVTDVSIRGRGLQVEITRTYGSRREYNSHFGYGWDMNYNLKVQRLDDPNTIVFLNGKGCGYEYTRDVSDPNKFVRSTYPHQFFKYDDVNDTFMLIKRESIEYAFDANDNLSSITDEKDSNIAFGYDANGLLTTIKDDLDREISLSYNNEGFLETITDFADRTWEYTYDPSTDELVGVTGPTGLSKPGGSEKLLQHRR